MLPVIEDDQVERLLGRAEVIDIVADAYRAAAVGAADASRPSTLVMRGRTGSDTHFRIKGAVLDALGVAGFRIIATGPRVSHNAYLYVADADTGRPIGLVSESWLYRIRTASTALVTCRALLPAGARTLALIGTGRIAEQFVRSCRLALPQVEIVLASRVSERAHACAECWRALTPLVLTAAEIPAALARADVVVTLSDAAEYLFKASELPAHALLCAMGGRFEFHSDVLDWAEAFVVDEMDFVCAAGSAAHWIETGELTRSELEQRLDATIGELLAGRRTIAPGKRTLAIIQGMAICDLAIAKTVLDRAGS
jgi:ornithine cyclodeaminase/alanine dehydrogenase-like protein (mu-crystallin family)